MKHDYKAALFDLVRADHQTVLKTPATVMLYYRLHEKTIKHALAMMQKLEEPSIEMLKAGQPYFDEQRDSAGLKAMLERAEREIEG